MPQVIFHRLAARDWYAAQSPDVAARFVEAVDRAVARVQATPEILPVLTGSYRWVRVGKFPYLLIVCPQDARTIQGGAVAHTSRRPGYWRGRS